MSNNLDLEQMSANQNQKEQTHNDSNAELDAAITEILSVDVSGGDVVLTDEEFRRHRRFTPTGATADQDITVPAITREFSVYNPSTDYFITVTRGTAVITVPPKVSLILQTDGTADGLTRVAYVGADILQVDRNSVAQTIATATRTKVAFDNIAIGNSNEYDAVTNYRHTPKLPGIWRYRLTLSIAGMASGSALIASMAKNATDFAVREQQGAGSTKPISVSFTKLVQMNGTTDYVECFVEHDAGANRDVSGDPARTYFEAECVCVQT